MSAILKQRNEGNLIFSTWHTAPDAAEAVEFIEQQLLGVWFGEKTPHILTQNREFLGEGEQNGGILFRFGGMYQFFKNSQHIEYKCFMR